MTVGTMKVMKEKKIDYHKSDVVKRKVYSTDEVAHIGIGGFSQRSWLEGWARVATEEV